MEWLKQLFGIIKRMPVAKWIKPLWRLGLKEAVQKGGDSLQESVKRAARNSLDEAPAKLESIISREVEALIGTVRVLPIPDAFKLKAIAEIRIGRVNLQERLQAAIAAGSLGAVNHAIDMAFDSFQQRLIERIDAL